LHVTVNDVYIAGITGALLKRTKYTASLTPSALTGAIKTDEASNKSEKKNGDVHLPLPPATDLKISAVIPVGLYACTCPAVDGSVAHKHPPRTCNRCDPYWDNCFGNRVTVVRMELECAADTPAARLRATKDRCLKMKR
jgi:hypothetical protein